MENIFFSFIINDQLQRFSIIGALSPEEENELGAVMASRNWRRLNCELNIPIEQQVNDFIENNNDYVFVPVNQVFPNNTHIIITTDNWSSF